MIWRHVTRLIRPFIKWGSLAALTVFGLAACSLVEIEDAPLTTFEPAGPFAERIDALFWQVFWIAAVIFVVVEGGILLIVFLFRDREGRKEPRQIHGKPQAGNHLDHYSRPDTDRDRRADGQGSVRPDRMRRTMPWLWR